LRGEKKQKSWTNFHNSLFCVKQLNMQKLSLTILSLAGAVLMMTGCAGPEVKLGRGINNLAEPFRLGELRRSLEQSAVLDSPDLEFTTGFFHGLDRTVARTGVGLYEVVTFPIPNHTPMNYDPIFLPANPVYPDSYRPNYLADQIVSPDTSLGFGGGDIAPMVPGSRFHIFDQ
jgi:putative exosortase-associated protein (TIGR04073 family)